MSASTAREIIRSIRHADEDWDAASSGQLLADRVEKVLALKRRSTDTFISDGYNACLFEVLRILNGEEV